MPRTWDDLTKEQKRAIREQRREVRWARVKEVVGLPTKEDEARARRSVQRNEGFSSSGGQKKSPLKSHRPLTWWLREFALTLLRLIFVLAFFAAIGMLLIHLGGHG